MKEDATISVAFSKSTPISATLERLPESPGLFSFELNLILDDDYFDYELGDVSGVKNFCDELSRKLQLSFGIKETIKTKYLDTLTIEYKHVLDMKALTPDKLKSILNEEPEYMDFIQMFIHKLQLFAVPLYVGDTENVKSEIERLLTHDSDFMKSLAIEGLEYSDLKLKYTLLDQKYESFLSSEAKAPNEDLAYLNIFGTPTPPKFSPYSGITKELIKRFSKAKFNDFPQQINFNGDND